MDRGRIKGLKLHFLQHVPFEGPANIEVWAKERGYKVSRTLMFRNEKFPSPDNFDWLIILGGPMGVYDEDEYPWLTHEKRFIEETIQRRKIVLGICLGAQLLADVLGGAVHKNRCREMGWFPVRLTKGASKSKIFKNFPDTFIAFHWHSDTFTIPPGCIRLAESEGCENQAFEYEGRVFALQFHLESSIDSIRQLVKNCGYMVEGKFIQKPEEMLKSCYLDGIKGLMNLMLNNMEKLDVKEG
jgi:GMP synthase-like glutamine amidotransferase